MPFATIPLAPGVAKDGSALAAKPLFLDADKMRAVAGKMETIYGQEQASTQALTGICRGSQAWVDLARTAWAAFGTHLRLHAMDQDGILYDTTPVIARTELANPLSVSSGSATPMASASISCAAPVPIAPTAHCSDSATGQFRPSPAAPNPFRGNLVRRG